jgi:prevent-host-death family protein
MNVYTYTQARQNLASVLDKAQTEGEVLIKRRGGGIFIVKSQKQSQKKSPFDIKGVDARIGVKAILKCIEAGRRK